MIKFGAMYMGGAFSAKSFGIAAEDSGFDSLWCGDHMQHYVDGIATLGCFAGCTRRITIGTNVIVAPFRPAVAIAKGIASAALDAEREVIAGIGVGGEFPAEFQATGAEMATRGAYTSEAITVVRQLWGGQQTSFHGRFSNFNDFLLEPAPQPAPQIWVGGRSDAALKRAASLGDGYIPYLVSAEQLARRNARLGELAAANGRSLAMFTLACTLVFIPADDIDSALDKAMDGRLPMRGLSEQFVRDSFLLGSIDHCAERIVEYVRAGARHVVLGCAPGTSDDMTTFMRASAQLREATAERLRCERDVTGAVDL